jgi:hypothetical protein
MDTASLDRYSGGDKACLRALESIAIMPDACFRFYEELNDFLPPARRKAAFLAPLAAQATVKQAIEALGVPHTEVELILVDGRSVDFGHRLDGGERVSVYPKFEAIDVAPLLRVRPTPLRDPRFVADAHLGGLARLLRLASTPCSRTTTPTTPSSRWRSTPAASSCRATASS